jgi:hypothetical protein
MLLVSNAGMVLLIGAPKFYVKEEAQLSRPRNPPRKIVHHRSTDATVLS